jgi:hypothetical protein
VLLDVLSPVEAFEDVVGREVCDTDPDSEHAELGQLTSEGRLCDVERAEEVKVDDQPVRQCSGEHRDNYETEVLLDLRKGRHQALLEVECCAVKLGYRLRFG